MAQVDNDIYCKQTLNRGQEARVDQATVGLTIQAL